ncbi:MAG: LysR family transcriptional regulator [Cyanobacteria bacterium J06588_5]
MDIAGLNIFVAVMRRGSFAAVARDRNIEPSSVSRAIASLETELGMRLFQRTTRKLSPTEAGTAYFERIEPLVEEIAQAGEAVKDAVGQVRGTLRVTASVAFGLTCIVPLLPSFKGRYPDLDIDLLLTDAVVDLLAERVDLAIRLGVLKDSSLIAQRLSQVHYRVCASAQYLKAHGSPQTPGEIAAHDCLCFPLAGFRSRWIFKAADGAVVEVPVKGRTVISNAIALQQCAISGMGLALLPDWLVDKDIAEGRLVAVLKNYAVTATRFDTAAWFVYPSRSYVPLKVSVFIDILRQAMSMPVIADSLRLA